MAEQGNLIRAATLTAELAERRAQLLRLFGEAIYLERTTMAKERIRETMQILKIDNAISAAITYCKSMAAQHPGEDVSTIQQFVLCAAADMAEGR